MIKLSTLCAILVLTSSLARASEPGLRERHAAVEAALTQNRLIAKEGKVLLVLGGVGLGVGAATAGVGIVVAASHAAASFGYLPLTLLSGQRVPEPAIQPEVFYVAGIVTGIVGAVAMLVGAEKLGTTAPKRRTLQSEKLELERDLAAQVPPTLLPQTVAPCPSAPPSDAPTR